MLFVVLRKFLSKLLNVGNFFTYYNLIKIICTILVTGLIEYAIINKTVK
jgi:hypothetical protein